MPRLLFVQRTKGIAGSEVYLLQLLPQLVSRGYTVDMLCCYPTVVREENALFKKILIQSGVTVHEIYGYGDFSISLLYKINKLIKLKKFDLVQTNLIHADLWIACTKLLFLNKIPMLSVHHGFDPNYQAKYGFNLKHIYKTPFYWAQWFSALFTKHNIVISTALKRLFVEGHIKRDSNISVIPYALNLSDIRYEDIIENIYGEYVLIIGRLIPVKGHSHLLRSWVEVAKKKPNLKLLIIGDGTSRADIENLGKEIGINNSVVFLGHQTNPHPYIKNCLFTVVTSSWEGFGMIVLESWLHKKAVISFDAPAMNEMIEHNKTGKLVPINNSEALANCIFDLEDDRVLLRKLGEAGYVKLINNYSIDTMVARTTEVYTSIMNFNPE